MNTEDRTYKKILFRLEKDEDGYPPDDWESLWAYKTKEGFYCLDNVPFFIRGISSGDCVSVNEIEEELIFDQLQIQSGHSVLRVLVFDEKEIEDLRKSMSAMGCEFEGSHIEGLIAFDIPPNVNFDKVVAFLQEGENRNLWEYEEASIRH